jgi:hypothetical protein
MIGFWYDEVHVVGKGTDHVFEASGFSAGSFVFGDGGGFGRSAGMWRWSLAHWRNSGGR